MADAHLMQADLLLAPALGGVRILVPSDFLQQSADVLAGLARGDYALDESFTDE
ncbi:hypothetical protein LQ564_02610 [Massilia sp. G4R7]|uniref:Uncharacterized protein n=1 Tax=Massilia phyllostachyos TaxID=2898585 RepID=A0ABS8Q0D0_9BURK|nr:hypothetical protein [Massilia phyllostachyos]